jgi:hypothetical protein
MQLDTIGWVNVVDSQDFIAQMVEYCAWNGISNCLLHDLMRYALHSSLSVSRITSLLSPLKQYGATE